MMHEVGTAFLCLVVASVITLSLVVFVYKRLK